MKHFVRIAPAMLAVCLGAAAIRKGLGIESEFMGPGLAGLFDIALVATAGILVTLSDREYFWATARQKRAKRRIRATR
jgi:hypothetical protein